MRHLSKDVHLVGSTIAIPEKDIPEVERFKDFISSFKDDRCPHVQSMAFCLSSEGFDYLMNLGFFTETHEKNKLDIICSYELRLSAEMIHNNWNIKCLLHGIIKLTIGTPRTLKRPFLGDHDGPIDRGTYFARTVSPHETIFAKINRGAISKIDLASYTFTTLISSSVPELIKWQDTILYFQIAKLF